MSMMEKRPSILVARGSIDSFPVGSMKRIQSKRPSLLIGAKTLEMYGQQEEGPVFVRFIIELFRKWGHFISKHPWKAITIVLLISTLANIKIFLTPQRNDISGYTPYGARAKDEFKVYNDFFASHGIPITTYIFGIAHDNGSMIRPDHLEEFVRIINEAQTNFTMRSPNGVEENFNTFCKSFCLVNEPIRQFAGGMRILSDGLPSARINLTYPISSVFGVSFSLQPNFFGIETYGEDDADDEGSKLLQSEDDSPSNATSPQTMKRFTNLKSVKMIAAQLRSEQKKGWGDQQVKDFEMKIVNYYKDVHKEKLVKIYVLSQTYVEEEMVRGGKIMLPYLVVGFIIMCCISGITVMVRACYMHQQNFYKVVLAVTACISPLLATATALAILFMFGVRFSSILCVIPFLVLSIGVDSSYLMIHEWQRVTKHALDYPIKGDTVGRRMSEVLSEVGPAILISCLTNMLADMVGSFTSSPEITLLCSGNMLAINIAFIYQMTFYCGLMCIVGTKEVEADEVIVAANIAESKVHHNKVARSHSLARTPSKFHQRTQPIVSSFMQRYVEFMANTFVSLSIIAFYITFIALSIWGITRININLSTQKLFAHDSPLSELDNLRVKHVVPHYSMATIFVNNPGNFSNPKRLDRVNRLVRDFEHLNGSWGPDGTKYFMRDYQNFLANLENDDFDYTDPDAEPPKIDSLMPKRWDEVELQYFLKWPEYDYWSGFVHTKNSSTPGVEEMDKFMFTTGFHGEQLVIWNERGKMLKSWRAIVDKYPELEANVFHEDGLYLDLIDNMATDTWQSVLGTLVCMALVCFLFLNNWFTVAIASLSVLSICCGNLGIMSWLNIDLDPITMASMIISIGFSVDIPAHVSYHYYQASRTGGPSSRPADRLTQCLSSVAFPAVQAALSTILCVSSLLFVNLYMAEVSCKILIICVLLCNIHGLIFIPAFLICLDKLRWACRPKGAAAQRPRNARISPRHRSGQRSQGTIAPEKSAVPDRPVV